MANNLRYLLEHFCLDGQKIDISSQLDEENANNIEKINTQTVPSINARIDDIKNTDIPNINSRIDSIKNTDIPNINQKINTINNTTIPNVQASVTAVDEKADRINESVAKNTRDIGTLSDNVTMQGNAINSINTEKIPSMENKVNELTTKVSTNTDNINELTTKVDTNTDSINTINNTTIPNVQASVTAVDEKADRINESVAKNTRDIGTLSDNVTMQGNAINSINTEKIPSVENKVEIVAKETLRISKAHDHDINGINASLSTLHDETSSNTSNIGNLTNNVNANTDSINELTTKVNNNTNSINTINNTSIPHLQSEIDNLSGGGTGSVGELREKVEKNTADISTLNEKVESNTTAISTINDTSIPNLQSEIDLIKESGISAWENLLLNSETEKGMIVTINVNKSLRLIEIHVEFNIPPSAIPRGSIEEILNNYNEYTPHYKIVNGCYFSSEPSPTPYGTLSVYKTDDRKLGLYITFENYGSGGKIGSTVLYFY